eukprot:EG_transcript_26630
MLHSWPLPRGSGPFRVKCFEGRRIVVKSTRPCSSEEFILARTRVVVWAGVTGTPRQLGKWKGACVPVCLPSSVRMIGYEDPGGGADHGRADQGSIRDPPSGQL